MVSVVCTGISTCADTCEELHMYNGLFGSHVAMVMRRLRRICAAVGNEDVLFVSCSATIENPADVRHDFAVGIQADGLLAYAGCVWSRGRRGSRPRRLTMRTERMDRVESAVDRSHRCHARSHLQYSGSIPHFPLSDGSRYSHHSVLQGTQMQQYVATEPALNRSS